MSDIDDMRCILLSAFETSERLMDECVARGKKIDELEMAIIEMDAKYKRLVLYKIVL